MRHRIKLATCSLVMLIAFLAWCSSPPVLCSPAPQNQVGWVDVANSTIGIVDLPMVGFAASTHPTSHAVGVSSCAATACHGGDGSGIGIGSAYSRWKTHDPHARAGEALYSPLAKSMAAILKRTGAMPADQRPANSPLCIQCHGSPVADANGGFTAEEGVSCEQCHGNAESYLDKHYEPQWRTLGSADKASLGFVDTKNLPVRADACLKCHQGAPGYEVTHELIAAGHPLLRFELRTYLAHYPGKHWRDEVDRDAIGRRARGDAPFDLAAWLAGQQSAAKAAAKLAVHRGDRGVQPIDFAEGDCTACHQNLMKDPAERFAPQLGRAGWFGWQESGLRLVEPKVAETFASFARKASATPVVDAAWRHAAAAIQTGAPTAPRRAPLLPQLKSLLDYTAIERERWEPALQRRLAAEALVAAARETYDETWVQRPGVGPAMGKLRRATAEWQGHRPANVVAAWKALEEGLDAALDD